MKTHCLLPMFITAILFLPVMLFCNTSEILLHKSESNQPNSSYDLRPDSVSGSTMNAPLPYGIYRGKPGGVSPYTTDGETIRYDNGTNLTALGSSEGTIYAASYFPAFVMTQYAGMELAQVEIYIALNPISATLHIYGPGTSTAPGDLIYSQAISTAANSWIMIDLTNPVCITGEDLWIGYEAVHNPGDTPAGVDAGPAIAGFGDMMSEDGITWVSMYNAYGMDYNWNLAGYLEEPFVCGSTMLDDQGNEYNTIQIGSQCWMSENLANLPEVSPSDVGSINDPYYYVSGYEGTNVQNAIATDNYQNYGVLYNWPAAMMACPDGWYLPTEDDWNQLIIYHDPLADPNAVGSQSDIAGGMLKSPRTGPDPHPRWNLPNTGATNEYGFAAIPGGNRSNFNYFYGFGAYAQYWSSAMYSASRAWYRHLFHNSAEANRSYILKDVGFSVRCFRNTTQPNVIAGADDTVCEGSNYQLYARAANYSSSVWTTTGTGTFIGSDNLDAEYIPGPLDYGTTVSLCIEVQPINSCYDAVTDCMDLFIQQKPELSAGDDATICAYYDYYLNPAILNYSSILWTTKGDGSFVPSATELYAVYQHGEDDLSDGSVELCLEAFPIAPCTESVISCFDLSFYSKKQVVTCPDNMMACEDDPPYELTGATPEGGNYSGTGVINNWFYPDQAETTNIITYTYIDQNNCEYDCTFEISVTLNPVADAGPDGTTCCGMEYLIEGAEAYHYAELQWWTTNGTGTFDDPHALNPVYTPTMVGCLQGAIELWLSAESWDPCTLNAEDCMILNFQDLPQAYAGPDMTVCGIDPVTISGANPSSYDHLQWYTLNGSGMINPENVENPTYTPSLIDIEQDSVILCLDAYPLYPCDEFDTDSMTIYFDTDYMWIKDCAADDASVPSDCVPYFWLSPDIWVDNDGNNTQDKLEPGMENNLFVRIRNRSSSIVNGATLDLYYKHISTGFIFPPGTQINQTYQNLNIDPLDSLDIPVLWNVPELLENIQNYSIGAVLNHPDDPFTTNVLRFDNNKAALSIHELYLREDDPTPKGKQTDIQPTIAYFLIGNPSDEPDLFIIDADTDAPPGWTFEFFDADEQPVDLPYEVGLEALEEQNMKIKITPHEDAQHGDEGLAVVMQYEAGSYPDPEAIIGGINFPVRVDLYPPAAITDLEAEISSEAIELQWTPVTLDVEGNDENIACYNIYRSDNPDFVPAEENRVGRVAVDQNDEKPGFQWYDEDFGKTTLYYLARVEDEAGYESENSNLASVVLFTVMATATPQETCEGDPVQLNAEVIGGGPFPTYSWTSDPPGFTSNQKSPVDNPEQDITYTVEVTDGGITLSASVSVDVQLLPVVDAGPDGTVCENESYTVTGATIIGEYEEITWVGGDGSWENQGTLQPGYTPGSWDILNGEVDLVLVVMPKSPCTLLVFEMMTLQIIPAPEVNCPQNQSYCIDHPVFELSGATPAGGTYSGPGVSGGYFDPAAAGPGEHTIEYISPEINGCTNTCTFTITVVPLPEAYAGADTTIIPGDNYPIADASASDYATLMWTVVSGSGTIDFPTEPNPTYQSAPGDCEVVELRLTAAPLNPCMIDAEDDMYLSVMILPEALQPSGQGTYADPYLIANLQNLYWISEQAGNGETFEGVYFKQTADIDASETEDWFCGLGWNPIGGNFYGNYNGDCHVIESLYINRTDENYVGLFGTIRGGAKVEKLRLVDFDITGNGYVGALAGWVRNAAEVECVDVENVKIHLSDLYGGGLTGLNFNSSIIYRCSVSGEVHRGNEDSYNYVGGFVGGVGESAIVEECFSTTEVISLNNKSIGGFAGLVSTGGEVRNSYSRGPVTASGQRVGGFCGELGNGTITNCFSTGLVYSPFSYVGGFVGRLGSGECNNNFWDIVTSGQPTSPCATGKTTAEMKTLSTFTDAGWDFENVWAVDGFTNDGYPALMWQLAPVVFAGDDATITTSNSYYLNGLAENYSTILWTTNGDGTFNNPEILTPEYSPGEMDILNGEVEFCLTAYPLDPCMETVTDCMTLSIEQAPYVYAGPDDTVCTEGGKNPRKEDGCYQLNGDAGGLTSYIWTTDGTGTFNNNFNILDPIYCWSLQDIMNGSVTLAISEYPKSNSKDLSDSMILTLQEPPTAYAGADTIICCDEYYLIADALATNYASLQWSTTNGTGTFDDETMQNPIYFFGLTDCDMDSIVLCVSASAIEPCTVAAEDCMIIYLENPPVADAGPDQSYCCQSYNISEATAEYYASVLWTTSGDGTFISATVLNPDYYPGTDDRNNGEVELCLTAYPVYPCDDTVTDCMVLTIHPYPQVTLGPDTAICGCEPFMIPQAVALHYSQLFWSTSGTGTFSQNNMLHPVYYPSDEDCNFSGSVELCLSAEGIPPCAMFASDCITVTFYPLPEVNCPNDFSVCISDPPLALSGATPAGGSYSGPGVIDGLFDPLEAGEETHTITYSYTDENGCTDSCFFNITVVNIPIANAGPDMSVCCYQISPMIYGQVINNCGQLWETSGDGSFEDAISSITLYFPGEEDCENGSVELCVTAYPCNPCTIEASDCMTLTLYPMQDITCPPDFSLCISDPPLALTGGIPSGGLYGGPGVMGNTFNAQAAGVGTHTIYYTYIDENGCENSCTFGITVTGEPDGSAGPDWVMCEGDSFEILLAEAAYYSAIQWGTPDGSGFFDDPNLINPIYTPAISDYMLGSVELCLNLSPIEPCTLGFTDCMTLSFQPVPTVFAGDDATLCEGESFELANAVAQNNSSVLWTTNGGTGTFSDPYAQNAVYTPGWLDYLLGSVELCLSASPVDPCSLGATDCITLSFQLAPTVFAGDDATICEGESFELANAMAQNNSSVLWTTNGGTGTFSDPYTQNPVYTPSWLDYVLGSVELCLSASPIDPCATGTTDCMTLSIESLQHIVQVEPGWSGISTYLTLNNKNITTVLEPVLDDLVMLYNYSGLFYPAGNIFTITEWDTYSGYIGKFSNANTISFSGCDPESKTIFLDQGWNIIPVLYTEPQSIVSLFAGNNNLQIVKEVAGTGIYWPAYSINTLGNVLPGNAYFVRMSAADSIEFAVPAKGLSTIKPPDLSSLVTPWNKITQTPTSHIVAFELTENALQANDIIGGFTTEGICAGLTKIQDASLPFAIRLNADDPYLAEKVGFNSGELIVFRLFRTATGEVFDLEVSWKPVYDHSGLFAPNGMSVVDDIKLSPTGFTNSSILDLSIYPNPNDGTFTIEGTSDNVDVRIIDLCGIEVYHGYVGLPVKVNISTRPKGLYFIRLETNNKVYFEKIILN